MKIIGDRYYYDYDKNMVRKMYGSAAGACALKLPKKNLLKELVYMTKNKKSGSDVLQKAFFSAGLFRVELKFNSSWYKSHAKKKLTLYTRGVKTKKSIQRKTKKVCVYKNEDLFNGL